MKQQERIEGLLKLIQENPELEIVPMVNTECVGGDDYGSWMAEWGSAKLDEYYCSDERVYFRDGDEEDLQQQWIDYNYEDFPNASDEELDKMAEEYVKNLEWVKCIAVSIVER